MWSTIVAGLRKRFTAKPAESTSPLSRSGIFAVAVFSVIGIFAAIHPSFAGSIGDAVAIALGYVAEVLLRMVGELLIQMIRALVWVAQYNGFVSAVPVAQGWSIVRDITNMFFIVILLIYAFGTILGVDAYSYKNGAVVKLLIMAVVINFSRTICGLLIDASQVVMLTFVYGFKEAAGGNFADALGITSIMQKSEVPGETTDAWSITVSIMLGLVMTGVSLLVIVVMTVCLAVRIIILWLLIVLSPLAFLTRSAPGGSMKGQYAKWWKMFTGQLIFGPVMAFFLWLALVSVASPDFTGTASGFAPQSDAAEHLSAGSSKAFEDANIQKFIIAICLLFGGLQMAKEVADNMSVLSSASDKVKGAYSKAKGAYQSGKAVVQGGARAAGAVGGAGIGLADVATGGGGTRVKNWALTQASKVPLIGGAAEARMAKDKAANQEIAKKASGRAAVANEDVVKARANERLSALGMDGQIERNEYQKKRVQDLAKKSKKTALSEDERKEYFRLSKSIKKHGKKFGDDSGDKVLSDIEKKNPSLIIDQNEKDPAERKRQAEAFTKAARSLNKQDLADMDPNALKGNSQLQAFLSPKQVLEAQKIATGDNLAELEKMGSDEGQIRDYQARLKQGSNVFGLLSEQERAQRVSEMSPGDLKELAGNANIGAESFNGSVLLAAVAANKAGALADKVAPTLDAKTLQENEALAEQIAGGVSAGVLAGMSGPAGDLLRARVAETDKDRALAGGASMDQAFAGYGKDGNFDTLENRAKFDGYMADDATRANRAGAVPADVIAKNGGINDVSISMVNNLQAGDLKTMAQSGKAGQVSEIIAAATKMAAIDTNDPKAVDKFIVENKGVLGNEAQLRATFVNAAKLVAETSGSNNPIRAAAQEKDLWKQAQNEYKQEGRAARERDSKQRAEHKLTRKLLKKGRTSRSK